jgi:AGZA family xanthine/uracil permease-like MFS transporter
VEPVTQIPTESRISGDTESLPPHAPKGILDAYFKISARGSTVGAEIRGGLTTFMAMAYIIVLNPILLSGADITGHHLNPGQVTTATALAAAVTTIAMGLIGNVPLAAAAGLGVSAALSTIIVPHCSWSEAFGFCVIYGALIVLMVVSGLRERVMNGIPLPLKHAITMGIGLFIAFIGLRNAKIIVPSNATTVTLGNLHAHDTQLAIFGLVLIAVLQAYRVKASMLIGVLATLALGILLHQVQYAPSTFNPLAIRATAFHLDIRGALKMNALEIIFVFLFVDLFDNIGTLVAVTERAGLIAKDHTIPRLDRIFFADATSTVFGALAGTSTVTSYIESSAGVAAGGRTGVTAIVTGLLFFVAIFIAPVVGAIPDFATAPALILVGALMLGGAAHIDWNEPRVAIPAFLTIITIPLTYSIATGLSFGLISYALLELATGRGRRQHWMLYLLATLFLLRFVYVAGS